jgi:hypothetical protein
MPLASGLLEVISHARNGKLEPATNNSIFKAQQAEEEMVLKV